MKLTSLLLQLFIMKAKSPLLLLIFRLLLGPILIVLTYKYGNSIRTELVILIFLGLLSDIFDGIIARKMNVSSQKFRRMDSQTDLVFWLCVSWCAWVLHPEIIKNNLFAISILIVMEVLTYVFSKIGRAHV